MNTENGVEKLKGRISEIDNYLKKEYDNAGVKPIVTEFYGFEVIVPYSYLRRNPDLYLDSFVQDFLGADYDSYDRIASEYEAYNEEIKFTNVDGEEVPVPRLYQNSDISEHDKKVLILHDAYAKYKKAVVLTALTNKLTGENELVNVRQANVEELYEVYDANRGNKSESDKARFKTSEVLARLGRAKTLSGSMKTIQYAAAAGAAIILMTNIAKTDKSKKSESDELSKNEIEFIQSGDAEFLIEKFDEKKEYEIKATDKSEQKITPAVEKDVKNQTPKKVEATAVLPSKAPEVKALAADMLELKIEVRALDTERRASELLDIVLQKEGLYGTTKKEINKAKKEKEKLLKAGKKVPYEVERNAGAKPIDQRTFAGVTNSILKAYIKKHPQSKKHLPDDVIYLKDVKQAKAIMKDLFHDHYKINKIEDNDLALVNLDALVNLSSRGRREVLQEAVKDVTEKHNKKAKKDEKIKVPGNWAETVVTTNKLTPKYKNELGNTILDYRDSYVSKYSHDAYKKGLHARNDALRKRFQGVQYAGNTKVKTGKERG